MTVLSSSTMHDKDKCIFHILAEDHQGPVSSKHLRRIYVFKCLRTCLNKTRVSSNSGDLGSSPFLSYTWDK